MTSLVTLSLNSYGTTVTHSPYNYSQSNFNNSSNSNGNDNNDNNNSNNNNNNTTQSKSQKYPVPNVHLLPYLQEGINQGAIINYSIQTVIEISKLNSFRASCIWQMMTSHLRIIASMKNSGTRYVAVAATLDVIKSALSECVTGLKGKLRRNVVVVSEEVS